MNFIANYKFKIWSNSCIVRDLWQFVVYHFLVRIAIHINLWLVYSSYYATSRSSRLIFMKFACLVRVHTWVNLIVFGNNPPNRTTDMGKNVPPKLVRGKNFKTIFGTPFPTEKVIFIFVVQCPIPWKIIMPPKNYFSRLFWKMFFSKELLNEKYSKPHFLQKRLVHWILSPHKFGESL